jgi:spermidine synthase
MAAHRADRNSGRDSDDDGYSADTDENADRVEILSDADRPGGFILLLDRVRQSYVDLDDPSYLEFEYVRWMVQGIDAMAPGPLAVTHLGAGAATLVRYVSAERPGSTHIVCEPDVELTALVRSRLPFARDVRLRIRPVDGRTGLSQLRDTSADLLILDAFAGGRVPADLGTAECAAEMARVLRASGLMLANVGDGGDLAYTRRVVAGLLASFGHGYLVTDKGVLSGRRYGNIVLMASRSPLPTQVISRGLAAEPFPCATLTGAALARWPGGARPFTDADSARSPAPPESTWRVAPD